MQIADDLESSIAQDQYFNFKDFKIKTELHDLKSAPIILVPTHFCANLHKNDNPTFCNYSYQKLRLQIR